jgi:hypothetical protein
MYLLKFYTSILKYREAPQIAGKCSQLYIVFKRFSVNLFCAYIIYYVKAARVIAPELRHAELIVFEELLSSACVNWYCKIIARHR